MLMADLYTITLATGTVNRITSASIAVTHDGNVYKPSAVIKRTGTECRVGISVDTMTITASGSLTLPSGVTSFATMAVRGDFDQATVVVDRAWFSDWASAPIGTLLQFRGSVSDVLCDRMEVKISVKSELEKFNILMPRRVYQAGCPNALFDYSCGLSKAAQAYAGTVLAGSTALRVITTASALPPGWCTLGTIEFTTGNNAGEKRTVKANQSGIFELVNKLPYTPAIGDAFNCYPGCDKTLATCTSKFNNAVKYRGQPYIPKPETAL